VLNDDLPESGCVCRGPFPASVYFIEYAANISMPGTVDILFATNVSGTVPSLCTIVEGDVVAAVARYGISGRVSMSQVGVTFLGQFWLVIRNAVPYNENLTVHVDGTFNLVPSSADVIIISWWYIIATAGGIILFIIGGVMMKMGCQKCGKKTQNAGSQLQNLKLRTFP